MTVWGIFLPFQCTRALFWSSDHKLMLSRQTVPVTRSPRPTPKACHPVQNIPATVQAQTSKRARFGRADSPHVSQRYPFWDPFPLLRSSPRGGGKKNRWCCEMPMFSPSLTAEVGCALGTRLLAALSSAVPRSAGLSRCSFFCPANTPTRLLQKIRSHSRCCTGRDTGS